MRRARPNNGRVDLIMEKIATAARTKEIIRTHGVNVKKSLGQNFLVDAHVLGRIIAAADVREDDFIVEIGPGLGGLTQELLEHAGRVRAVEIDGALIPVLRENLQGYDNVEIIHADALKADFAELFGGTDGERRAKVVANLPYYVTTPIIMRLLEEKASISSAVLMVQREVAARMAAQPGEKDYGALSLAVGYYAKPYLAANVPRNSFIPRPNVDSAVVRLDVYEEPPVNVKDEAMLFALIRAAFSMRRKTLLNCLRHSPGLGLSKEDAAALLVECGFGECVRGEELSLKDYAALANAMSRARPC